MNAEQTIRAWQSLMVRLGKAARQPMPASVLHPVLHAKVDLDQKAPRHGINLRGWLAQVREERYGD